MGDLVKLKVPGEDDEVVKFKVSASVLKSCSPLFASMLEGEKRVIKVKNFKAPQFQIFCDALALLDSKDETALEQFATIKAIKAVLPVAVHYQATGVCNLVVNAVSTRILQKSADFEDRTVPRGSKRMRGSWSPWEALPAKRQAMEKAASAHLWPGQEPPDVSCIFEEIPVPASKAEGESLRLILAVEKCLLQSESAQWPAPILSLIADSSIAVKLIEQETLGVYRCDAPFGRCTVVVQPSSWFQEHIDQLSGETVKQVPQASPCTLHRVTLSEHLKLVFPTQIELSAGCLRC